MTLNVTALKKSSAQRSSTERPHLALVSDACDVIVEHLDDNVAAWVAHVRHDIPEYLGIPVENHVATNRDLHLRLWDVQLRMLERPSDADLAATREVGRLRASQGMPLEALIAAYQLTHREIWEVLRAHVPATSELLGELTTFLLERLHLVIEAVSQGYRSAPPLEGSRLVAMQRQFIEAVQSGADDHQLRALAEMLGLAPSEQFVAAWVAPDVDAARAASAIARSLHGIPSAVASAGEHVAVLAQSISDAEMGALLDGFPARIGIGMPRPDLAGARLSLGDAERAVEFAETGAARLFAQCWLWSSARTDNDRLSALLDEPKEIARRHPDLAATVRVLLDTGFSLSKTAARLHVHPNTAAYRIDRWSKLTGLDVRTAEGLAASLIVVGLPPRSEQSHPSRADLRVLPTRSVRHG